jgi:phosphoribosylaminoimidazole-succinocarboxamide synthase
MLPLKCYFCTLNFKTMSARAMIEALTSTTYFFEHQTSFYRGKVRDIYTIKDDYLVSIASDRISAFDCVLKDPIPYKGQVLNQTAAYFLERTRDIVPNWLISSPDPHVSIGYKCDPIPIEMVVRGYLAGHAWREYRDGRREICGVSLPEGLKQNDKLPEPIITPATKAQSGHDEDISLEEIVSQKIVSKRTLNKLVDYSLALYNRGVEMATERNLILVDTKYEFGMRGDEIYLIDEVHTPDSSRYFHLDQYDKLQKKGQPQLQLSKEFVREWLMEKGFDGQDISKLPVMPPTIIKSVSDRYIALFEAITQTEFVKRDYSSIKSIMEENIKNELSKLI